MKTFIPFGKIREYEAEQKRIAQEAHKARLKTLKCPRCGAEFKQANIRQIYCRTECTSAKRELPEKFKNILRRFEKFLAAHSIEREQVVSAYVWRWLVAQEIPDRRPTAEHWGKFFKLLDLVMDRFHRGFYIITENGIEFQNPPWRPYCPVDHTYCNGAVLPGDCPRQHTECAYHRKHVDEGFMAWKKILQSRGKYEFEIDDRKVWNGSFGRKVSALIGGGNSRIPFAADAGPIRSTGEATDDSRPSPATGDGL